MLLSSCTGLSTKDIQNIQQPSTPYDQTNDYSTALDKFSAMLVAYGEPDPLLVLLGKTVQNKTACGNLPMDITQMVATAVNRLGGQVRYIPYGPTYLELEARLGLPVGREIPALVIDGAITECDENLDNRQIGIQTDLTGTYHGQEGTLGGGYDKTNNFSRIAIDLHLMEYQTSILLPQIQTSMAVDVRTIKGGYDFSIQVLGSGFGLNRSRKISQGKHESIRTLVDMSILQLLGRHLQVPYWRCLPNATPDQFVIRALKDSFARVPQEQGITAIQYLLQQYGHSSVQPTGILDNVTKRAIADVAARSNSQAPATVSSALYSYLYLNRPLDLSHPASIMPPVAYVDPEPDQKSVTAAEPLPSPAPTPQVMQPVQPALGLQTAVIYRPGKLGETVLISGGKLKSGDSYKVVVEPEQDCHLYVFQRDSAGRLFSIFPRIDRNDGLANPIRGNIAYEFPGNDQYFFLDQRKGEEYIYFYSTTKPDQFLEQAIRQLNQKIADQQKQNIEKELLHYLATKDTISTVRPGKSYILQGKNGVQTVKMNRVQKLSDNKLYIFSFNHQ